MLIGCTHECGIFRPNFAVSTGRVYEMSVRVGDAWACADLETLGSTVVM